MKIQEPLPTPVLDHPVRGFNLSEGSLRAQLGFGPTLLVFLRHLG